MCVCVKCQESLSCIFISWNAIRSVELQATWMIMLIFPCPPSLLTLLKKSTVSSGFGLALASHSIWRRVRDKNQSASILYWTQFLTHLMALRLLLSAAVPTDRANDRWSSHLQQFGYRIRDIFSPLWNALCYWGWKKKKSLKNQSHFQRHPNELASKSQILGLVRKIGVSLVSEGFGLLLLIDRIFL